MFIFITEDGEMFINDTVQEEDKLSSDAGILDIIDTAGDEPTQYNDGEWHQLQTWGEF
jgi:hypothetical protein